MPLLHFYAKNKSHHLPSLEFPASPLGRPQAGLEGHWSEPGSELTETPKNGKQGMKQHFIGFNDHLKWITNFLLPVYIKQERNHTWATAALCFFISSLKSSWSSSILDCRSFFSLCRRLSCSSSWKKKRYAKDLQSKKATASPEIKNLTVFTRFRWGRRSYTILCPIQCHEKYLHTSWFFFFS